MGHSWLFFLFLVVISLVIQGFYSMLEMASVSFNRVRLQYFVSQKNRRAQWLSSLLKHPTHLFGATLIGVNTALQFGSECARRFYISLELSPDWALLSQVFIVLIFAELVPMFAARRYAEHVAMLGVPLVYFTSLILRPIIWVLEGICRSINWLFGVQKSPGLFLTRDELQKVIEAREDTPDVVGEREFDPVLVNIFSLKNKTAKDLMDPIEAGRMISSHAKVVDLRNLLGLEVCPFVPVYHHRKENIVAIAYPRDLLRLSHATPIRSYCRSPWFITEKNSVLEIMKAFRRNNQSLAVVLNDQGEAMGLLTLDRMVDEIFGRRGDWVALGEYAPEKHRILVDRSFRGETLVSDINQWFGIHLKTEQAGETLEDLMARKLGHRPERGESITEGDFELTVEESSLIMGKTILMHSIL